MEIKGNTNKISNDELKRLNYYINQILPLVHEIRDTDGDDDDLIEGLSELVFEMQRILGNNI